MNKSILEQLEYLIAQSPDGPGMHFISVERSRVRTLIDVARGAENLLFVLKLMGLPIKDKALESALAKLKGETE